jgi:large subunit ribosomal protein L20
MPRSVNSVASRNRKRKVLKAARGYFGARSKVFTVAKNAVDKAMKYAYTGRKLKKRAYRRLWIARINAAVRPLGLSYSVFIHKLSEANINLNRKVLADLALHNADAFKAIVEKVK